MFLNCCSACAITAAVAVVLVGVIELSLAFQGAILPYLFFKPRVGIREGSNNFYKF